MARECLRQAHALVLVLAYERERKYRFHSKLVLLSVELCQHLKRLMEPLFFPLPSGINELAWPTFRRPRCSNCLAIQVSFTGYDVEDAVLVPHQAPRIRRAVGFQFSCLSAF